MLQRLEGEVRERLRGGVEQGDEPRSLRSRRGTIENSPVRKTDRALRVTKSAEVGALPISGPNTVSEHPYWAKLFPSLGY